MNPDTITAVYDAEFFAPHARREAYGHLARFLTRAFRPASAVDFGCGLVETLRHLREAGCPMVAQRAVAPLARMWNAVSFQLRS